MLGIIIPARGWDVEQERGGVIEWQSTNGGVAQSGEHLLCKQGVRGSNPLTSTIYAFISTAKPLELLPLQIRFAAILSLFVLTPLVHCL